MSLLHRPGNNQANHAAVDAAKPPVATQDRERDGDPRSAPAGRVRMARPGWLVALVALLGLFLLVVFGLLAFRLVRIFAAHRAAQGVAIAQRRSGEMPAPESPPKLTSRQRPPEAWAPAVPTALPDAGSAGTVDPALSQAREHDSVPLVPAARFVIEESNTPPPKRVPNHLFVDTQPHGAGVWIDGVWKGKTPLDVLTGPGGKELVLVAAGFHIFRDSFDAHEGAIIRRALVPAPAPVRGDAFLNVVCRTEGKYPLFVDEVETGLLCPASRVPVSAGPHRVGAFVPGERKLVAVEVAALAGPEPVEVSLTP